MIEKNHHILWDRRFLKKNVFSSKLYAIVLLSYFNLNAQGILLMIKVVGDVNDNNKISLIILYKISILNLFVAYEHSLKL